MAYPTVKLKRSSVSGRVPDSSQLAYGELAINYEDGKLYWKSASNIVKSHIIDSEVQDVLTRMVLNQEFAQRTTDSLNEGLLNLYYTRVRSESDITDIVDSAYIQFLQLRYLDSANTINLIDSAYVASHFKELRNNLSLNTYNIVDSGNINITGTITSTGNVSGLELTSTLASADEGGQINLAKPPNATIDGGITIDVWQNRLRFFVQGGTAKGAYIDMPSTADGVGTNLLTGAGGGLTEAQVINLVDSAYVQARQLTYDFLDSAEAIHLIDSAYVNARLNRSLFLDSAEAIHLIDSAYVNARLNRSLFLDSAEAIDLIDSAYVNARLNRSLFLDSAEAIRLVDSAYVNARLNRSLFLDSTEAINLINVYGFDSTRFNGMFAAKSTTNLAEGTNKYYTRVRFDSDFGSKSTTNLAEGTNKYYTTARADSDAKRAISVTDAGGDGSLSYVSSTGVITYTGPSATEVRAHFSAGQGIKINSGVVSLDSADSAVFAAMSITGNATVGGNLTIDGDFYVGGTTTTITASNLAVSDNMIYLNQAISTTVSNAVGSGTAVVYTTIQDHNYQIGFSVTITGVNPSAYNLTNQTITAITTNSFTVANSAVGSFVSGGTARAQTSANPDLGFAFGYRDSSYHHGGFFRDATDGYFKIFHKYNPEPDSSVFINTSDSSFTLADMQANNFRGALIGNASTATQLANVRTFTIAGDVTASAQNFDGTGNVTLTTNLATGVIVNDDINASAAIVDTKLATISTAGKVSNSATTATNANTGSAIVARDVSGNFSAGTITAALSGNATTATTLQTARTIGDVSFNGSSAIVPERTLFKDTRAVNHNPYTYPGTTLHLKQNTTDGLADGGTYHGVLDLQHWSDSSGGKDHQLGLTDNGNIYIRNSINATTWTSWVKIIDSGDTTALNTADTLVRRDASGNFSAGTITAALTGNATTATTLATARDFSITGDITASAISFNGSGNVALNATITAGSIVSADFNTSTSLIIYNSAGTVLKTIYSPGS